MKKLFYAAASVCLLAGAIGCSDDYDDSALWDKMNGIDGDIENIKTDLEALKLKVEGLNETYKGIAALLNAGMITGVEEVSDAGRTGYKFIVTTVATDGTTLHSEYTIWNGTDGQDGEAGADGTTPQLGVAKDEATGRYYWTVTIGEETTDLTDADGNKIWATGEAGADGEDGAPGTPGANGTNGKDGVTPQLKIEARSETDATMVWKVSYDNGTSWTELGVFSGDVSASSISVSVANGVVTILQDGKDPIEIPIVEANNIKITIADVDESNSMHLGRGLVYTLPYTLEGASESAVVKAEMVNGTDFSVKNLENAIEITTGTTEASDKVLVHVYDGKVCFHTSFTVISDVALATIAEPAVTLPLSYAATEDFVYTGRITLDDTADAELAINVTAGTTTLPEGSYEVANGTIAAGATEGTYTVTIKRSALTAGQTYDLALVINMDGVVMLEKDVEVSVTDQPSKINLTADMLTSQYNYEGTLAMLCDGVLTNHWGSNYDANSCPAGDATYGVYIDIELPIALRSAKFRYYTRHGNGNAVPTEIKVGVSNDKTAWTELFMANTGLPDSNAQWWEGDTLHDAAEPFSNIRFGITKSKLGNLVENAAASTALTELEVYGLY